MALGLVLITLGAALAQDGAATRVPMEVGLRYRSLAVPDSFIDPFAYDNDDPDPARLDRPKVRARAVGLEYSLVEPTMTWTFGFEAIRNLTEAGYWDDVDDDGGVDHNDGQWIDGTDVSIYALEIHLARELAVTPKENPVWLGFNLGGGLGLGIRTGEIQAWFPGDNVTLNTVADPTCLPDATADGRYATCVADDTVDVPKALPLVNLDLGLKLNVPHGYLRLEGGLHDMAYWGLAAGGNF